MSKRADVLILGGGVIGLTTAYFLVTRAGVKVSVIDRGAFGRESSWAGAGIITPGRPDGADSAYDWLRTASGSMIAELSAELRDATGIHNGYRVSGGIEIPADELIDLEGWARDGIEWHKVNGDRLQKAEPALAPRHGDAYFVPQMAQIRNPRHMQALVAALAARGVELRPNCQVFGFEREGNRVAAVQTSDGRRTCERYLICAGAWTDTLLAPLGCRIDTRPIRGQIAMLRTDTPVLNRIIVAGKRYLVPRDDGRVLVGSTEEDVGFDKSTTADAIGKLLCFASETVPALGRASVEQCWAGLRPGSADGLPTLGRISGIENLWVAAGHFRTGLQQSAATAMILTEALTGRPTRISLDAFRPGRQPLAPTRPAFRS